MFRLGIQVAIKAIHIPCTANNADPSHWSPSSAALAPIWLQSRKRLGPAYMQHDLTILYRKQNVPQLCFATVCRISSSSGKVSVPPTPVTVKPAATHENKSLFSSGQS
jgi:hypothetical protein